MIRNDAATYPRSYSATVGWKLFLGILGSVLGLGGVAGILYFGTGHEVHSGTHMIVLVGVSLAMAVLGFTCVAGTVLTKILVLTSDELQVPGIFRTTVIHRAQISGYRFLNIQGINVLELHYAKSSATKKKKQISMLFSPDPPFAAWFEGIPNFDAVELAASVEEVERDAQLGATPQERLENVNRARKIARLLYFVSLGTAGWAIAYPKPYMAMFAVVASLPWLALWLCKKYKGSFSIDDAGRNSARADLTVLLIAPGAALAVRAISDVPLIDATQLIAPALLGVLLMMSIVVWVAPVYRRHFGKLALLTPLMLAYPAGVIAIANVMFDGREPEIYKVPVLKKYQTSGKGASQYFHVPGWGPYADVNEIRVSRDLYRETDVHQFVCVQRHPGTLGLQWYSTRPVQAC